MIITKTVVKDYVTKKCPYLVSLELDETNRRFIDLLKKSVESQAEYKELIEQAQDDSSDEFEPEDVFNINELLKDYPNIRDEILKHSKQQDLNDAEKLVEKYNDDQIVSTLSRRYFINHYGKEHCVQCDIDDRGGMYLLQQPILDKTQEALKDPNIKVIFEGQIEYNDLRARFDVLIKNEDGSYDIIEVKGTNDVFVHPSKDDITDYNTDNRIKPKYLYDLLFQYYVYGLVLKNINELGYMFTNRDFRLTKLTYPVDDSELDDLFIIKKEINLKKQPMSIRTYFDAEEYTREPRAREKKIPIEDTINEIRQIGKLGVISPKLQYECKKGPVCPFLNMCFEQAVNDPNSILKLTNWNLYGGNYNVSKRLMGEGKTKISEVPLDEFEEIKTPEKQSDRLAQYNLESYRANVFTQVKFQHGLLDKKYFIDWKLMETVLKKSFYNDEIKYLLFFDFESFQYPIPLVAHSGCWKQIVSQYSMHVVEKGYDLTKHDFDKGRGGGVTHYEYIADPDVTKYTNPSNELYETLLSQLKKSGIDPMGSDYRVVVFNKNFEKTRMNEFVKEYVAITDPSLRSFVQNFNDNVVDLLDFFTLGGVYCRDFNGRGSLKVVQPTLAADQDVLNFYNAKLPFDLTYSLDYHKGDKCLVYNGAICLDLYKSLLVRSHLGGARKNEPSTHDLLAEALAYCKIDSWGTVIIYDIIKNVYLGNLKLDAEIKQ